MASERPAKICPPVMEPIVVTQLPFLLDIFPFLVYLIPIRKLPGFIGKKVKSKKNHRANCKNPNKNKQTNNRQMTDTPTPMPTRNAFPVDTLGLAELAELRRDIDVRIEALDCARERGEIVARLATKPYVLSDRPLVILGVRSIAVKANVRVKTWDRESHDGCTAECWSEGDDQLKWATLLGAHVDIEKLRLPDPEREGGRFGWDMPWHYGDWDDPEWCDAPVTIYLYYKPANSSHSGHPLPPKFWAVLPGGDAKLFEAGDGGTLRTEDGAAADTVGEFFVLAFDGDAPPPCKKRKEAAPLADVESGDD
jgi:hypothetical protein